MVDTHSGLCGNGRFRVQSDTGTGELQHTEIIGTIANGQSVVGGDAEFFCNLVQGVDLGLLAQNGFRDEAGQQPIFFQQDVGTVFVEAQRRRDAARKYGEAAGNGAV